MLSIKNSVETKKPSESTLKPNSLTNSVLHHHPRSCLLFVFLSLQILLLLHLRSLPFSGRHLDSSSSAAAEASLPPSTTTTTAATDSDQCQSGRVFVYDLPESFNKQILTTCTGRTPWGPPCDSLSNSGLGPTAAAAALAGSGLIPERLAHTWFNTDQFATEVIFHHRMLSYRCRTTEPESATAFYIPFYAGLAVAKYLWEKNSTDEEKDRDCNAMLTWLREQRFFKNSGGWDHFISMGRISWDFRRSKNVSKKWGSSCIYLEGMANVTRLLIERNPWDPLDVGVPYPTAFHPSSAADVAAWQDFVRARDRHALFSFAGATRGMFKNDFRGLLLRQCAAAPKCRVVDCSSPAAKCAESPAAVLEAFLGSEFCLQPRGDSFTRRSMFDCMVAGAIPVFFWHRTAYHQYEWFLPSEPESYSVFIDRNAVKNGSVSVKTVLESFTAEEKRKMREKVIEYIPRLVYSQPREGLGSVKDAFDVALDGVFRRFKEREENKENNNW